MADLETIFKSEYAHQPYHGIRDRLFQTKCGHLEPYELYAKRLSEESIVIHVNSFIWEVTNGDLTQFLSNSDSDNAEEALQVMIFVITKRDVSNSCNQQSVSGLSTVAWVRKWAPR